jgi:DUF1680 family protein
LGRRHAAGKGRWQTLKARSRAREQNVRETSVYPWSGDIRAIDPETRAPFDLKLRVPGWGRRRDGADQ